MLDFVLALITRRPESSRGQRWIAITLNLLAVYVGLESLEGLLAAGHAGGVAAAFGNGGWVAIPLAGVLAAVVTLVLRGAEAALVHRARTRPCKRGLPVSSRRPSFVERPAADLAAHLAGRGPTSSLPGLIVARL